ncbi:MAG: CHAT domain-containing protein/Flp pilus assembly protein TadD [Cyclobacteriaceae bacterium]|jgi:CHAT domain-containing protein/Flp pilus assembly protein TadD
MRSTAQTLLIVLGCLIGHFGHSQYVFDSKKAEKQYYKFDDAYMDYDINKVLDMETEMLTMFEGKEDTVLANVYSFLGETYVYELEDFQKGIKYYEDEYELRSRIQPNEPKGDLAYNLAGAYDLAGQYSKSEKLYLVILEEDKSASGRKSVDYVMTVQGLADHYTLTGEADKGLDLVRKNRRNVEKGSFDEALMLRYEGDFLEMKGQYTKAKETLIKSLETMEKTGYNPSLEFAYTLNALGTVYTNSGDLSGAEKILNVALDMLQRNSSEDEEGMIGTKYNLSTVYQDLGLYDEALSFMKEIVASDLDYYGGESDAYLRSTFTLAYLKLLKTEIVEADQLFSQVLGVLEDTDQTKTTLYAETLNALSKISEEYGDYDEAIARALSSIALREELGATDGLQYILPIGNLATIYMKNDELEKAETYANQSLELYKKVLGEKHPQYAIATRRLAILKWQQKELEDALGYYGETFDNYFAQINAYFPILSEDEKSKFYYNKLKPTFEQFNSFVIENRSEDPDLLGKMYDYQLATKGLIFYATNKVRESILGSGDSLLIGQYETWISQKESLAQLFSSSELEADIRTFKIDSLTSAANQLEKQLSEASSVFASNFASQDLTWRDVKATLKPGEAAIEIIRFRDFDPESGGAFTDEVYYAALIVKHDTEEAPELVVMRNGLQMETKYLSNYRNAIKYQMNEVYSYRLFWRPLSNKLEGIDKLFFSPDGVYNQISIYTLQNPATKQFTIDEFEFQLVTNTKDLIAVTGAKSKATGDASYLFGYPNYNLGGATQQSADEGEQRSLGRGVSRGARGSSGNLDDLALESLPRGIRGNLLRYMGAGAGMPMLPGTLKEVSLIDSLYGNSDFKTTVFMDDRALEERIKEVKNPKTLHIATHGFFLEEQAESSGNEDKHVTNPMLRSGLIMAGANSYIRDGEILSEEDLKDDGILTAYEAMNLNLDETELVVLSACETGLGEVKNGEGVFGLQRAFKVAGADAIIMSMWTVDDAATQELMTIFYEEWLSGKTKAEAFNMAQKRLKDKWKKPYYWGAFVMIGE